MPIAGLILAFVMMPELIQIATDKNNFHEVETAVFFRWIFKTAYATLINVCAAIYAVLVRGITVDTDVSAAEKIARNIVRVLLRRPKRRPYQTGNYYADLTRQS